jgi:hypothetical protein
MEDDLSEFDDEEQEEIRLIRRGNPVETRAWLDSFAPDFRAPKIGYLFRFGSSELVKAVVLRDGRVWARGDMGPGAEDGAGPAWYAISNADQAVLEFVLAYPTCHMSQHDQQYAISFAAHEENLGALRQLLRDKRFDPTVDHNEALQYAGAAVAHRAYNGEDEMLASAHEMVRLLLRDSRVLRSVSPEPDTHTFGVLRGGAELLRMTRAAIQEERDRVRRREAAPVVRHILPMLVGGLSGHGTRHIMEYADLTCATPGMCDVCKGKRI